MRPAARLGIPGVGTAYSRPFRARVIQENSPAVLPPLLTPTYAASRPHPLGAPSPHQPPGETFRDEEGVSQNRACPLLWGCCPAARPRSWDFPALSFSLSDAAFGKVAPYLISKETSSHAQVLSNQMSQSRGGGPLCPLPQQCFLGFGSAPLPPPIPKADMGEPLGPVLTSTKHTEDPVSAPRAEQNCCSRRRTRTPGLKAPTA